MTELTCEVARSLLRYEPETGKLIWLPRPLSLSESERACKLWNTQHAGTQAFYRLNSHGYLCGKLLGRTYTAHRVVWLITSGAWPTDQIDHIDGDRTNNRLANLREVTRSGNMRNRCVAINNTSGTTGVSWHAKSGRWKAQIRIGGKTRSLGTFDLLADAREARLAANRVHGFSERRPEGDRT